MEIPSHAGNVVPIRIGGVEAIENVVHSRLYGHGIPTQGKGFAHGNGKHGMGGAAIFPEFRAEIALGQGSEHIDVHAEIRMGIAQTPPIGEGTDKGKVSSVVVLAPVMGCPCAPP